MKKVMLLMLTVFSFLILISCGNKDEEIDEFIEYNNSNWISINKMRSEQIKEPKERLGELEDEEKNEEAITIMEDEILPIIYEYQKKFKDIELKHKKNKKLNDMEIESHEILKDRVKKAIIYYRGGDVSEIDIQQFNEKIVEKSQELIDYRYELIDEYDLEYVEEDESLGNYRKLRRKEE